ncbi:hypothetical protein ISF_06861 [Cordyceps fumosorosea ARSEF 2679]|uniref:Uncharacterized protein n=1 Tax=Cordyceps fumosorosea (strain ARSEF 2679) TaxID=1081104 RepID=A0A167R6Q8_CORFA|nr:hypothetical protein ISF_06861 [Cordyceps fumosorosea ARSEF 2679]OAA58322.1 hypothetical protein ISF_06861 [Cordyceps fumosorosea ARSEF 2679]
MTYPSGFSMPGAFHSDIFATTTTTTSSSSSSSSQPLIFRPPLSSPSPSGSAFLDVASASKRKRVGHYRADTPVDDAPPAVSLFGTAAAPQHTPVKAYALAGTLDTPGGGADSDILGESAYSDSNYRTALGSKRSRNHDDEDSSDGAPTSLYRHNNHNRAPSPSQGWGSVAINAVGGVVGRVWEFCKAGAFKGFYAGGGRGFAMTETGAMVDSSNSAAPLPPADDDYPYGYHYHHNNYDDYNEHRVPGHFPASQPETSYHTAVDDTVSPLPSFTAADPWYGPPPSPAPSIPTAKRRQTTHADDLGRNWVIVNDAGRSSLAATPRKITGGSGGYRSSPRNRNHTPSVTTGRRISTTTPHGRPPSSYCRPATPSEQTTPQLRPPSSASFASPRSASPTKLTSYHQTTASTASTASPTQTHAHPWSRGGGSGHRRRRSGTATSVSAAHRRTNSTASAASSRGEAPGEQQQARAAEDSPRLDAEAKQLAARRKMEERDADVRISAFNKRLQDMIRQGKEALGTTIEIDDAGGDDWVDED